MIGDSNDESNFPDKLLSTETHILRLCKIFANGSLGNTKFPKTQLSKMVQISR